MKLGFIKTPNTKISGVILGNSHNIQSVHAHFNQFVIDQVHLSSGIILLNQTWISLNLIWFLSISLVLIMNTSMNAVIQINVSQKSAYIFKIIPKGHSIQCRKAIHNIVLASNFKIGFAPDKLVHKWRTFTSSMIVPQCGIIICLSKILSTCLMNRYIFCNISQYIHMLYYFERNTQETSTFSVQTEQFFLPHTVDSRNNDIIKNLKKLSVFREYQFRNHSINRQNRFVVPKISFFDN